MLFCTRLAYTYMALGAIELETMADLDEVKLELLSIHEQQDVKSRLEFLYKATDDTQNTIRFIDTKAAFCVTLLSGMVAVTFQATPKDHHYRFHEFLLLLFLAVIGLAVFISLRVIFPVIKPPNAPGHHSPRKLPKYYIPQSRSHHWIRHTFSSSVRDVLSDTHDSLTATMTHATDSDLVIAMCDEVLMVSLIRQIKQDRLRTAMFSLMVSVVFFLAVMMT
jgi:hypothetical protein